MRSMCSLSAVLASLLLASAAIGAESPAGPQSSPSFYVCTADAQVIKYAAGVASIAANGTGTFDDCVVGPDGGVYIANGAQVVRFYPSDSPLPVTITDVVASGLPSAARGLAFNVKTLYINTQSSGVYAAQGSGTASLSFSSASQVLAVTPSGGHGLTFDVEGNLAIASGGSLLRSTTPQYASAYSAAVAVNLGSTGGTPFGLALNTCQNVVYTDPSSQKLKRLVKSGSSFTVSDTNIAFTKKDLPLNVEIDSSNRTYVLTGEDAAGANAKVVLAEPANAGADATGAAWIATCGNFTLTTLLDLKASLSGQNAIAGLISANAVGLAVVPTAHKLSKNLSGTGCDQGTEFNFGYHTLTMYFAACPGSTISVTANKSKLADVQFDPLVFPAAINPAIHGVPYSPLGGFPVEYVLNASPALTVLPSRTKYSFFTQDGIARAGLARTTNETIGGTTPGVYDQDVSHDFWDVGALDASVGGGDDFSKHIVYNTGLDPARSCTIDPTLEQPLNSGNPLFNSPQTIKIAPHVSGTNCDGGHIYVSIVRVFTASDGSQSFAPQIVSSGTQTDNVMDSLNNGKYVYNLDATRLDTTGATKKNPAQFLITMWGDVAPFKNQGFEVSK